MKPSPLVSCARTTPFRRISPVFVSLILAATAARAQSLPATGSGEPPVLELEEIAIIGSKQNLERLPGSGVFIEATELRPFFNDDIHHILRRAPGVYLRQEEGYGLFPNVSLRGVSTTRNSKVTVMEDGILMAPAPYADPAAYYTPNAGRMSGLEVLKGSSQIRNGPETTGGVINHLSTPIPRERSGFLDASYGSDNDVRVRLDYGGRFETSRASIGFLVEHAYRRTDGFKTIAPATGGGFAGSDRTGFKRNEPMVRLRFDFKTAAPQTLEFKYGRTDMDADETYLGLTDADFRANPHLRYASSRFDLITTGQERLSARYAIRPLSDLKLSLTAYKTDFARNWYKLNDAAEGAAGAFRNPAEILAGQHGAGLIEVLRGGAEGRLRVRANNRAYGAEGVDTNLVWDLGDGPVVHRLEAGARWHSDFADRFQWDDIYTQTATGAASRTTAGIPGAQENRRGEADAFAVFLQDRITAGALTVTPGVRFESIDYADIRRSTALATLSDITSVSRKSIDYFAPGVGLTWAQDEKLTWLAGVHRGVSPPGPGSAGNALEEETSLGFEAGLRFNNRRDFSAELIAFHTAFKDLIVEANAGGGGGAGQTSNIGRVDTTGLELALAYDPAAARGWSFRNPWNLSLTWTRAELANDVNATGNSGGVAESIFSGGRKGNRLPYVPDYQIALGTGILSERWGVQVDAYFQPRTFTSANNSPLPINPDASAAAGLQPAFDSRYGRTDAFLLVDVAAHYRLSDTTRLKLACTNLLDWEYIASRVPLGPRPGPPRALLAGVEIAF